MEKLKDRVDIKHVKNSEDNQKFVFKPIFVSQKMFNKKMIAFHKIKEVLTLNKPVSVDMCILDLSKALMYDFHYNNYIKKKYSHKAKLLFTDTNSLMYEIETNYVYKDIHKSKDKSLILENIQKIQNFMTKQTKK